MIDKLRIVTDEIAEHLDELADLGEVWNKHRKAKRMPSAVRQAMIQVSSDISFMIEVEQKGLLGDNIKTNESL